MIGALFGVIAAFSWGGGDFLGGLASRRLPTFFVVATSQAAALALLVPVAMIAGGAPPSGIALITTAFAGVVGGTGVLSLYAVEGPSTQLRGAATAPHWRNQGIGEALMRAAIAAWWSDTSAPRNLWCNARVAAITLYERLGFVAEGERFEFPQVGPHQRMRWVAP